MKKIIVAVLVVLMAASAAWGQSKVITRPVTIVCAYSAGGGTDQVDRGLAEGMKEYLGVQVNVVNMTGAGGGVAMDYVWQKPRDGLNILGISETGLFVPANAAHTTTAKDWQWFWAGGSPGVVLVPENSKYKTIKELIDDAKARPGQVKAACSVLPGVWSIRWMTMMNAAGVKTNVLPYAGSAPSVTAALTGEVDIVHVSVGEALQYMQAKKLRPLVASEVEGTDIPGVGKVQPITDFYPELKKVLPMPQLLGMAIPMDTPQPIKDEITKAFNAAMKSEAVKKVLEAQVATPFGWSGDKANDMSKSLESKFSWMLVDLNLAKKNPAELGIPKP
jgi:tripartite-type tricarboxylate transporter receptor subunit TctC